jgi:D-ribose pyranose/furanose isomerase RbsD
MRDIKSNHSYHIQNLHNIDSEAQVVELRIALALEAKVAKLEEQLLNAFQLVKNGKRVGFLKYDEFKIYVTGYIDHKGIKEVGVNP